MNNKYRRNIIRVNTDTRKAIGLTSVMMLLVCAVVWPEVLVDPNGWMMTVQGDGLKNYFTPAWYVKHGSGLTFEGYNYPFGEHVVFTDNQPLLSSLLSAINQVLPIEDYTVGIINSLMFLNLILCSILLVIIQRRLNINWIWAAIAAVFLTIVSPHLSRMYGQMAMSYCALIPWVWLLVLNIYEQRKTTLNVIVLFLTLVFSAYIHMYPALICVSFVLAFSAVMFILDRSAFKHCVALFCVGLSSVIITKLGVDLTDSVTDRMEMPPGFLEHYATPISLLFGYKGFPFNELKAALNPHANFNFEQHVFLGLVPVLTVPFLLIKFLSRIFKKQIVAAFRVSRYPAMRVSLLSAGFVLLFSFAVPFKPFGLEWLADYTGSLRHFRVLGRFAWVFYFVFGVFVSSQLYDFTRALSKRGYKKVSLLFITCIVLLCTADSIREVNVMYAVGPVSNHFQAAELIQNIKQNPIDFTQFDAIVPYPLFHIGSEYFPFYPEDHTRELFALSYQTGLPLAGTMSARTSLSQTQSTYNFIKENEFQQLDFLDNIPESDSVFLILVDSQQAKAPRFIEGRDPFQIYEPYHLYSVTKDEIKSFLQRESQQAIEEATRNIELNTSQNRSLFFQDTIRQNEANVIFEFVGSDYTPVKNQLEFSAWFYLKENASGLPWMWIEEYDSNGNKLSQQTRPHSHLIDRRIRQSIDFTVFPDRKYIIRAGKNTEPITDVLFRKRYQNFYSKRGSVFYKNTVPIH